MSVQALEIQQLSAVPIVAPHSGSVFFYPRDDGKFYFMGADGVEHLFISTTGNSTYSFTGPSALSITIPFSTHNVTDLKGVLVYDADGNQVYTEININFSTKEVTIDSNINLINSTIKIF